MLLRELLLLCSLVHLAVCNSSASRSPNAEIIEKLFTATGSRYSNDIVEDAILNVPDLITKYGYPVEIHSVVTTDGYILEMHRIPHGRDAHNKPDPNKPVVFLMHGIVSSSADWVVMGPGSAFGYVLAENGYDVWMGNARGNHYSRRNIRLNPDAILNTDFWKFSWDEIGRIDLPAMIDYITMKTGKEKLHYAGHSQGTTSFFVMASMKPVYNEKIISMHALAPVAYMAHNQSPLLHFLSPYATDIEKIGSLMGVGELLPNNQIMTWAGLNICSDEVVFQPICSNILFLIAGWDEQQLNTTMLPVIFGHAPAGASVRQFVHYAQGIAGKGFRRYDLGSYLANLIAYGKLVPPSYELSKVTAPVFLHYSDNDNLAQIPDVDRLFSELGRPIGKFRVPWDKFNHIDHIWGINAKELVYDRVVNLMNAMNVQ